jgi:hypothetical protein
MCDYSLEVYKSQPAEVGEKYQLHRFPSGTMGLAVVGSGNAYGCPTAACLKEGSKLLVTGFSSQAQEELGIGIAEEAIFTKAAEASAALRLRAHRDAVLFSGSRMVLLQQLGGDVSITLLSLPEEKLEQSTISIESRLHHEDLTVAIDAD